MICRKNSNVLKPLIFFWWIASVLLGCVPIEESPSPTLTPEIILNQYETPAQSMISEGINQVMKDTAIPLQPTTTSTPFYYIVEKGDTFSSIAHRHGVKLPDLIASNPNIDPNFLTIGITITIPITGSSNSISLAPTPIPLFLGEPNCFSQKDGGIYCLIKVTNNQSFNVENVTAEITIQNSNEETTSTRLARSSLNLLKTGKSTVLTTYFPPPNPINYQTFTKLMTVLPVSKENNRYHQMDLRISTIELSEDNLRATISGIIASPPENQTLTKVWVLGIAYDSEKKPIGVRKWESTNSVFSGDEISFQMSIYSLGPEIENVEVFYEAGL